MSITFCVGVSSNLWQQKSPIAEVLCIYFLRTIFWRKFMRKISAVGLFCCDKFEETPKQKVINMSKLNKLHFSVYNLDLHISSKTLDLKFLPCLDQMGLKTPSLSIDGLIRYTIFTFPVNNVRLEIKPGNCR